MIWENNVDYYLLHKSEMKFYRDKVVKYGVCRGRQPFNFVIEVLARYEHYKNMEEAGKLKEPL
jgi:membrane-bound lytic murein transglycosylase F